MSGPIDPFRMTGPATRKTLRRAVIDMAAQPEIVCIDHSKGSLHFLEACPACDGRAARTMRLEQMASVEYSSGDGYETEHEISAFNVPFCESCIARHRTELPKPDATLWLRRMFSGNGAGEAFGGAVVLLVALFFFKEALLKLSLSPLLIGCFPLLTGSYLIGRNWHRNRYMAVPPPTSVSSAVEFTPILAADFEPPWQAFRFRNAAYAEAFRQVNNAALWDPRGEHAQEAKAKRKARNRRNAWIIGIVIAAVCAWGIWDEHGEWLKSIWRSVFGGGE